MAARPLAQSTMEGMQVQATGRFHVHAPRAGLRPAAALAGLSLIGTGAAMLLGALGGLPFPVGAATLCMGILCLALARGLPGHLRLSPVLVASVGVVLLVGIIVHGALTYAAFDIRRLALALLGVAMQVTAPFLDRSVHLPVQHEVTVSSLVASVLALVGTPLLAWVVLSAF